MLCNNSLKSLVAVLQHLCLPIRASQFSVTSAGKREDANAASKTKQMPPQISDRKDVTDINQQHSQAERSPHLGKTEKKGKDDDLPRRP